MTNKLKKLVIPLDIFNLAIVCIAGPFEHVPAFLAGFYNKPGYQVKREGVAVTFMRNDHSTPVIWLERAPLTSSEIATVAHEAIHAVSHVMRYVGVEFGEDSEEVYCYATEFCVKSILNWLQPTSKRRRA